MPTWSMLTMLDHRKGPEGRGDRRAPATALTRISRGNFSNVESVGSGVFEYKLDFGPGYRIYFGKDGETLVILLGGGTKKRQRRDINAAHANWQDYKRRK